MIEWISVKERLPVKTGRYLCVYSTVNQQRLPSYADFKFEKGIAETPQGSILRIDNIKSYITHWAEINLPEENKK